MGGGGGGGTHSVTEAWVRGAAAGAGGAVGGVADGGMDGVHVAAATTACRHKQHQVHIYLHVHMYIHVWVYIVYPHTGQLHVCGYTPCQCTHVNCMSIPAHTSTTCLYPHTRQLQYTHTHVNSMYPYMYIPTHTSPPLTFCTESDRKALDVRQESSRCACGPPCQRTSGTGSLFRCIYLFIYIYVCVYDICV